MSHLDSLTTRRVTLSYCGITGLCMAPLINQRLLGVAVISAALSASIITVIAALLRRKRKPVKDKRDTRDAPTVNGDNAVVETTFGELELSVSSSHRSLSSLSSISRASSACTLTNGNMKNYNVQQLCSLGLQHLHRAEQMWEEALIRCQLDANSQSVDKIRDLLERARRLRETYESEFETNAVLDAAIDALQQMNAEFETRHNRSTASDEESLDSYVSALETPDLSDLQERLAEPHSRNLMYEAGLLELQHGSVPYRKLRTALVGCQSDSEFLAKLHVLRISFDELMKSEQIRQFFLDTGTSAISSLMLKGQRDPSDFITAVKRMEQFISSESNCNIMRSELSVRGVKCFTMYDIVLDWILMDAFDDLANPPSSVISVAQNRWLSDGLKETALSTAIWSILKAKRRMLKEPSGFISHFYAISEIVSPVLAWAFLGPDGDLKSACLAFRQQCLGFIQDIFNMKKVRYTIPEEMSEDILAVAKQRASTVRTLLSCGEIVP